MWNIVDLAPETPGADPITRFILIVLWQAQEDGATDVIFGRPPLDGSGTPLRYKVGGTWYDMKPFPSHIRRSIVARLECMAGLSPKVREGILECEVADKHLRWKVQMMVPEKECTLTRVVD